MEVKIDRGAKRRIAESGGLLTIEARAKAGCMVKTELEARTGKPEEPALFVETETGGVRVFARGLLETPDGTVRPSNGALPKTVRVRERDGGLSAEAG